MISKSSEISLAKGGAKARETTEQGGVHVVSDNEEFLKSLWARCFTRDARWDPDARARAEEAWREQRHEHLPRTLELIRLRGGTSLFYGSRHRAERGQRTLMLMAAPQKTLWTNRSPPENERDATTLRWRIPR